LKEIVKVWRNIYRSENASTSEANMDKPENHNISK